MTGDDSLALDSITSDYRFMLEHDVSMLEIALAAVSFEDCSLDDAVPLDRASVAYDCWLEALESLHPGHRFRGFGLSDAELADDDLLGRITAVDGVCRLFCLSSVLGFGKCWMGFIHRPDANCNSSTDSISDDLCRCHSGFSFFCILSSTCVSEAIQIIRRNIECSCRTENI